MPSLFRFLFVVGLIGATIFGSLYFIAAYFEPEPKEVSKIVSGVKIRKQ